MFTVFHAPPPAAFGGRAGRFTAVLRVPLSLWAFVIDYGAMRGATFTGALWLISVPIVVT